MTKSGDTGQNVISGLCPHERLRLFVGVSNVGPDRVPERLGTSMHPAPQLFLGEQRKPPFHQIEPGGTGRGEMHMKAGALQQPAADEGGLVCAIVVEDQVHVQLGWNRRLNRIEKLTKFAAALPLVQLPDHLPRPHIQGSKQRGGPVASIVVRAPLNLPRAHRQQRPRPVQCLNLCVLIHAQHQRFVWRIQVQANDITDLLDKERILGKLERFGPMRLQAERSPDPADGALTEAAGLRHVPATPVSGRLGRGLQCQRQDPLHVGIASTARGAGTGLIQQAVQPTGDKALSPAANRLPRRLKLRSHDVERGLRKFGQCEKW